MTTLRTKRKHSQWMRRAILLGIVGGIFFVLPGMAAKKPAPAPLQPFDLWYGVYFGSGKIGFANIQGRAIKVNGQPAFRVENLTSMRVNLLGHEVAQDIDEIETGRASGSPLITSLVSQSGGHTARVTATYLPHVVHCIIDNGDGLKNRDIPIPAGVKLGSSDDYAITASELRQGASWSDWAFDPATLAIEKTTASVTGRKESPAGSGKLLWLVDTQSVVGSVQMLVDRTGMVIRTEMPLGMAIVKETRAQARAAADYHPTADLAEAGAVVPDAPINDPRAAMGLQVTLHGVPASLIIPTGSGQKAERSGPGTWQVAVSRTPAPSTSPTLPETIPAEDLQDTPELNAASAEMKATAKRILGGEKNSFTAMTLLHDWVNVHMQARYDIGVLRSGLDVLHQPEGVCRDYAMLYTSLARAAGIPTRICSGLVCWHGKFYYHAWAESFVGDWVRVDPTMPGGSVDATHIALARGDARSMYRAASVVGNLKMHLIRVK